MLSRIELKALLEDSLNMISVSVDCSDPSCDCEGNEESKNLVERLGNALYELNCQEMVHNLSIEENDENEF